MLDIEYYRHRQVLRSSLKYGSLCADGLLNSDKKISELDSKMARPRAHLLPTLFIPSTFSSALSSPPYFAGQASLPSPARICPPLTPSSSLYFENISKFHTDFVPCVSLLQALRPRVIATGPPSVNSCSTHGTQHRSGGIYGFLDALAILCDVPYVGDTCTAVGISEHSSGLTVYVTANTTSHAIKAAGLIRNIFQLLHRVNPKQRQKDSLRFQLDVLATAYAKERQRTVQQRSKDPRTLLSNQAH